MPPLIMPFEGDRPAIADDAFIAPGAVVVGDVAIGPRSSIWYNVVVRADVAEIRIGRTANIQDGSVVHVTGGVPGKVHACHIGDDVLIGHMAVIHGCELQDGCFVGMKACVMDGAVVETGAMVAAGALVTPGKVVRSGELWGGSPARKLRNLTEGQVASFKDATEHYADMAARHRKALADAGEEV